jgi:hypothetical protein
VLDDTASTNTKTQNILDRVHGSAQIGGSRYMNMSTTSFFYVKLDCLVIRVTQSITAPRMLQVFQ